MPRSTAVLSVTTFYTFCASFRQLVRTASQHRLRCERNRWLWRKVCSIRSHLRSDHSCDGSLATGDMTRRFTTRLPPASPTHGRSSRGWPLLVPGVPFSVEHPVHPGLDDPQPRSQGQGRARCAEWHAAASVCLFHPAVSTDSVSSQTTSTRRAIHAGEQSAFESEHEAATTRWLLRLYVDSGRRFHDAWTQFLEDAGLDDVNRLRDGYNRPYPLEKACAFGTEMYDFGFTPLPMLDRDSPIHRFPLLSLPELRQPNLFDWDLSSRQCNHGVHAEDRMGHLQMENHIAVPGDVGR